MRLTCQKTLIVGLLISGLFADCGSLFASQKMQPMINNAEMQYDLSSNESLLMQFQNEKDELIRTKAKNKEPHLLKNKLKILDAKITFLQAELRRTKPAKAQVSAPIQAPKVLKAKTVKAPLAVLWRPRAPLEPRYRIFLAVVKNKVEPQPIERQASRQDAETKVLPKQIQMQPFSQTERDKATPAVRSQAQLKSSERAQPMEQVQVQPAPAAPAVHRASVPGQKSAKTGRDWEVMTEAEKDIYVLSVMGNLGRHDVFLEKSHDFYIRTITDRLRKDPSLKNEYVHKILIAIAYENEPESRPDLDKIGQ